MALCVDVVVNHTAREHAWAQAALDGDAGKLAFYRTFGDRTEPDAYEATLPEVFPDIAPGSFTYVEELGRWVWTTFNDFQWDLDYTNPAVFRAMAEAMLDLAAAGVDVLRLDAVPFLWKRKGTDSQNQPEVHELLQAFRAALRIAAPGVAFKAEAIVSPRELVRYLGAGRHEGKECDLAYHNVLMVLGWSALATGSAALLTHTLQAMPPVPAGAGWVTYVRCHDDIGWAITEEDAGRAGENAHLHRRFLARLLRGRVPRHVRARRALPARAVHRRGAHERQRRVAGGARGGAGVRRRGRGGARDPADPAAARARVRPRRHAAALHGRRARPAQRPGTGPTTPRTPPTTAGCTARRWTGRPRSAATTRARSRAGSGPACGGSASARRGARAVHAQGRSEPLWTSNPHVLALLREHAGERLLLLANFTPLEQAVHAGVATGNGFRPAPAAAGPDGRPLEARGDFLVLAPYQFLWIGG